MAADALAPCVTRFSAAMILTEQYKFKFKIKCFIFPTEIHNIIYNVYVVHSWREGGERSIAYRAVHLP